ncbi:MAG TPA: hypothetical protein VK167_04270 [Flavipsychrobacter sp.]|nr:hypothetical protein [Flavipsychrobacter sp.]
MEIFFETIEIEGIEYPFKFEPVNDAVLNELYYIVTLKGSEPFIMAIDFETGSMKVQGEAPYIAKENEDLLSDVIDKHNRLQ